MSDGLLSSRPVTVTITTLNSPPIANAGPDQTVNVGNTVSLNGSTSSDVDGNPLTFAWSITSRPSGSTAALSNPAAVMPSFVADRSGQYVVQLIVNDGTVNSAPDTVVINTGNSPPIANAGPNQTVTVTSLVHLNGSGSSDVDGNALTFAWSFVNRPSGSTATLSNSTAVMPTFTADALGDFVLQLIVNDSVVNSAPDTVTITTTNSAPTANAGPDQTVAVGAAVHLNGTASSDPESAPLTYSWSLVTRPAGSATFFQTRLPQHPALPLTSLERISHNSSSMTVSATRRPTRSPSTRETFPLWPAPVRIKRVRRRHCNSEWRRVVRRGWPAVDVLLVVHIAASRQHSHANQSNIVSGRVLLWTTRELTLCN